MEGFFPERSISRRGVGRRYLTVFFSSVVAILAVFVLAGLINWTTLSWRDHFGQLTLDGDDHWYRNFEYLHTQEMQDRDVLFQGIGASISNLKQADIVILGHSVLEFGLEQDQIKEFERKYNIRIFNLTMPGVASGEFSRLLIKKWDVHPKIWIINADDYPTNFFEPSLQDFFTTGRNSIDAIVHSSWWTGYQNAVVRNTRYTIEMAAFRDLPDFVRNWFFPSFINHPKSPVYTNHPNAGDPPISVSTTERLISGTYRPTRQEMPR
jgi:hypothetical protein